MFFQPGVGLAYSAKRPFRDIEYGAQILVDGDIYDSGSSDLNNSRLDFTANAQRSMWKDSPFGGIVTGEYKYLNVFSSGYDEFEFDQKRYTVGYRPEFGKKLQLALDYEYRASGDAAQRRHIGRVTARGQVPASISATPIHLRERLSVSDFRDANSGRQDITSETRAWVELPLPGMKSALEFGLTYTKNWSDIPGKGFENWQFGPTLRFGAGATYTRPLD